MYKQLFMKKGSRMSSKLKRLPNNSYTIIIKFENIEDRIECMNLKEYKELIRKMCSVAKEHDCKFKEEIYIMEQKKWIKRINNA